MIKARHIGKHDNAINADLSLHVLVARLVTVSFSLPRVPLHVQY